MKNRKRIIFAIFSIALIFASLLAITAFNASAEESGDIVTEYGTIPASQLTETSNFAIFVKNSDNTYTFVQVGERFVENGIDKARQILTNNTKYNGSTAIVYMLKDHTTSGTSSGAGWNGAYGINGTVIVDLGGKTLTSTAPRVIGFEAKTSTGGFTYDTGIEFKNGTINSYNPLVEIFGNANLYSGTKVCNIKFDNVTLTGANGSKDIYLLKARSTAFGSAQKADFSIEINNCTLDYQNHSRNLYIVEDSTTAGGVTTSVTVRGGTVKMASLDTLTVSNKFTSEDSFIFAKNASNARTQFSLNYTENAPDKSFDTDNGRMYFASVNVATTAKDTIVYALSATKTPYGYIPEGTQKTFIIFYNSLHLGAYDSYYDALNSAKNLLYPKTKPSDIAYYGGELTIYMTKDYIHTDSVFANLAQLLGTVNLDLGGNVLTQKSNHIFDVVGKAVNNTILDSTNINVKNGTILTNDSPVIKVSSSGTTGNFGYNGTKTFNFTYENVTFDKNSSVSAYAPLINVGKFDVVDNDSGSKNIYLSASFKDCMFNSENSLLFNLSTSNYIDSDITIIGGNLTTEAMDEFAIMTYSDGDDKLSFAKNSDGKYMTLDMHSGASAPAVSFNNGALEFVKVSESASESSFVLTESDINSYSPKISITLHSGLALNVYVPVNRTISFTLDGIEYDISTLGDSITELSDGKMYYHIKIALPASKSARDIPLNVSITTGVGVANGRFTFSIPKYASKIINSSSAERIEKDTVKDILAYIKSAYVYFNSADKEAISEKIDEILGDYSNTITMVDGTSNTAEGLYSVKLVLLDNPVIRFYLEKDMAKESYTFKYENTTLPYSNYGTESFDGIIYNYVDISLYAYQLMGTISYSNGINNGYFHINSYVDFIKTNGEHKNNEELIDLVQKLYIYCKSALAYREYFIDPCDHEFDSNVKTKADAFNEGETEYTCIKCGYTYSERIPTTLTVLAIGNSFSVDAMQHLYLLAKDLEVENVVLGTLYIGGCTVSTHYTNIQNDNASYTFYVSEASNSGEFLAKEGLRTIKYGITYCDWDYITLQQASNYSGMSETLGDLMNVINYINANKTSDAEILWHMTWAYQQDSTHSGFANYNNDQATMYNSIVSLVTDSINTNNSISGVIPVGTAIQNLRTSPLGDTLTRDGYHLSYGIGRYTAALTWLAYITGCDLDDITATPSSYPEIAENMAYIKDAVKNAISVPFAVTNSSYAIAEVAILPSDDENQKI